MKGEAASLLLTGVFAPEASGGHAVRKPKPTHVERPHRARGLCQPHLFRPTGDPTGDRTGTVSWNSDHRAHGRVTADAFVFSLKRYLETQPPVAQSVTLFRDGVFIEVIKLK